MRGAKCGCCGEECGTHAIRPHPRAADPRGGLVGELRRSDTSVTSSNRKGRGHIVCGIHSTERAPTWWGWGWGGGYGRSRGRGRGGAGVQEPGCAGGRAPRSLESHISLIIILSTEKSPFQNSFWHEFHGHPSSAFFLKISI